MSSHFMTGLQQIDAGGALDAIDEQLAEVLEAVRNTGKKGSLQVSLIIAPNGRGYEVTAKVAAKAPELDFGKSFFFTDANGHLSRTPPQEASDDLLRSVDSRKAGA